MSLYARLYGEEESAPRRNYSSGARSTRSSLMDTETVQLDGFAKRYWARVQIGGQDNCWPWMGPRLPKGYGKFFVALGRRHAKLNLYAHRVAWAMTHGPIPDGLCVLHKCDNPPCCNPSHLFLGTDQDNVDDKLRKGRQPVKLTDDDIRSIRQGLTAGRTMSSLSAEFGVCKNAIFRIRKGEIRRGVP